MIFVCFYGLVFVLRISQEENPLEFGLKSFQIFYLAFTILIDIASLYTFKLIKERYQKEKMETILPFDLQVSISISLLRITPVVLSFYVIQHSNKTLKDTETSINQQMMILTSKIILIAELICFCANIVGVKVLISNINAKLERSLKMRKEKEYMDIVNAPEIYDF